MGDLLGHVAKNVHGRDGLHVGFAADTGDVKDGSADLGGAAQGFLNGFQAGDAPDEEVGAALGAADEVNDQRTEDDDPNKRVELVEIEPVLIDVLEP